MEKRNPHYPLVRIKSLIEQGAYRVTQTARDSALSDFGLAELSQIAACILALTVADFQKSMATLHNSRLWQDVYCPVIRGNAAYVKVQIADDSTVVISFKRR